MRQQQTLLDSSLNQSLSASCERLVLPSVFFEVLQVPVLRRIILLPNPTAVRLYNWIRMGQKHNLILIPYHLNDVLRWSYIQPWGTSGTLLYTMYTDKCQCTINFSASTTSRYSRYQYTAALLLAKFDTRQKYLSLLLLTYLMSDWYSSFSRSSQASLSLGPALKKITRTF